MNNFIWALKFLTIIPIDKGNRVKPGGSGSVVFWFPIVGLCIGAFVSITYVLFNFFFPPLVLDALIILIYIIITRAMHLDGFADTCDGIWGGWNKERRLEIMRDSRIGSFGAVGLICLLGLKYLSLLSVGKAYGVNISPFSVSANCILSFVLPETSIVLLDHTFGDKETMNTAHLLLNKSVVLMVMPVVGRWAQVCAAGLSLYARSTSGIGSFILEGTTVKHVIYSSIFPIFLFWFFYCIKGIGLFILITIFTLFWIWYIKRKIGGMTGDTLGATNEIIELVFLLGLFLV